MDDDRRHLVVVAAVAVALVVVGVGALALDCGGSSLRLVVHGDVDVSVTPSDGGGTPGRVTVVWVDDGRTPGPLRACPDGTHYEAESTRVDWALRNDTRGTGGVEVTNGTRGLERVGASVTISETDPASDTRLDLVVTAVHGDAQTVILDRSLVL